MGAARYLIFGFEEVAKREGVRVVIVDRYAFSSPLSLFSESSSSYPPPLRCTNVEVVVSLVNGLC